MPYIDFDLVGVVTSLAAAAVVGYLIFNYMKARSTKTAEEPQDASPATLQEESTPSQWSALELVADVLKNLNCKIEEHEHGFRFRYQNELFGVYGAPGRAWVQIVDYAWFSVPLDSEECAQLLYAVNEANVDENVTAFCMSDENGERMAVMAKCYLIVLPDMPHLDEIVPAWLAQFFDMKRKVMSLYEKNKEKKTDFNVKPVGEC